MSQPAFIRGDIVKVTNADGTVEFIIENASSAVDGFAKNVGAGQIEYQEIIIDDVAGLQTALNNKQDYIGFTPENPAHKNTANGYAGLDSGGKVPASILPSYVDDVVEFANFAALPGTGETGKIYVTIDNNKEYRWSGSTYIQLVASPGSTDAVPEGSTNFYFTEARVLASILAGIGFGSAATITAGDSILSAFGKLQAQTTSLFSRAAPAGGSTGDVLTKIDGTDYNFHWAAPSGGGGGSPGGSDKEIQYNAAGVFGSSSKFKFDSGASLLNLNNSAFYMGAGTIDATALFQMDSTAKGFLPPRMTAAQRTAITTPAAGLLLFQTDATEGLYLSTSTGWVSSSPGVAGSDTQIQFNDGGGFGASADLTFDKTTKILRLKGAGFGGLIIDSTSTGGLKFYNNGVLGAQLTNDSWSSVGDLNLQGTIINLQGHVVPSSIDLPRSVTFGSSSNASYFGSASYGSGSNSDCYTYFSYANNAGYMQFGNVRALVDDAITGDGTDFMFKSTHSMFWGGTQNYHRTNLYLGFIHANKSMEIQDLGTFSLLTNAILALNTTTKVFLPPRMTTTQKNAISSPPTGGEVFDTTLDKKCVYTGSAWETVTSV